MTHSNTASPEAIAKAITLNNSTPLDIHRWSDHPEIDRLVAELYEQIDKPHNTSKARAFTTLKVLLLNLYAAYKANPTRFVAYSRRQNDYTSGSRYNRLQIERNPLAHYIDRLKEKQLIEDHLGCFYSKGDKRNRQSRMRATPALTTRFDELVDIKVEKHPNFDTIILKDTNKKLMEYGTKVKTPTGTVFRDPPIVACFKNRLASINALYQETDISIDMSPEAFSACHAKFAAEGRPILDLSKKRLYRVFNDGKFNLGGRFYGGWWQSAPKKLRKRIIINGEETVERDYKAIHPSIIYLNETGKLPVDDPYQAPEYKGKPIVRNFMKKATLSMMNATSFDKGFKAVNLELTTSSAFSEDEKKFIRSIGIKSLLKSHKEAHPVFWKYMRKDMGKKLQYHDSKVAEAVLVEMTKKGICCLPVHDSFIVSKKHELQLLKAMQRPFIDNYGVSLEID